MALDVNLDMVGHSERGELYASGTYHTPSLTPALERVAARAPVKLLLGHDRPEQGHDDWTNQSDQYAFHKAGIPFVYFGVEDHKDYHKPPDDFETLTQRLLRRRRRDDPRSRRGRSTPIWRAVVEGRREEVARGA